MRLFSFSQPSYNGSEDDGYVSVCMELIDGTLTENVIIVLESTASYTSK